MRIILIVCFILLSAFSRDDDIIDLEDDEGLESLANYLENHDVLVIGESTHASKDIDRFKIELIKCLNKNSDYNILALETSKAELDFYMEHQNNVSIETIQKEAVAPMYRRDTFDDIFQDAISEDSSLEIKGMNWQPVIYNNSSYNAYYLDYIFEEVIEFNNEDGEQFKNNEFAIRNIIEDMININNYVIPYEEIEAILINYNNILESDYFNELDSSSQVFIKDRLELLEGPLSKNYIEDSINPNNDYYSRRGLGMFENISELVDDGNKVIVWVHNFHILKDPQSVSYPDPSNLEYMPDDFQSLGTYLSDADFDAYTMGLYFNQATNFNSLYFQNEDLDYITDTNYLEGQLSTYNKNKFFVDLESTGWSDEEFISYDEGFIEQLFKPGDQYDGLIYIDKITE